MHNRDFTERRKVWTDARFFLSDSKAKDYARPEDRLDNFKRIAYLSGQDPRQVWLVYFMKHILAIANYVRNGQAESEPILGRVDDAQNYLDLFRAFILDEMDEAANRDEWLSTSGDHPE